MPHARHEEIQDSEEAYREIVSFGHCLIYAQFSKQQCNLLRLLIFED